MNLTELMLAAQAKAASRKALPPPTAGVRAYCDSPAYNKSARRLYRTAEYIDMRFQHLAFRISGNL